jgi:hypothetical protein
MSKTTHSETVVHETRPARPASNILHLCFYSLVLVSLGFLAFRTARFTYGSLQQVQLAAVVASFAPLEAAARSNLLALFRQVVSATDSRTTSAGVNVRVESDEEDSAMDPIDLATYVVIASAALLFVGICIGAAVKTHHANYELKMRYGERVRRERLGLHLPPPTPSN